MSEKATPEGLMELFDLHGQERWNTGAAEQARDGDEAKKSDDRALGYRNRAIAYATRLAGQAVQGQPVARQITQWWRRPGGEWQSGALPAYSPTSVYGANSYEVLLGASTPPALPLPEPSE